MAPLKASGFGWLPRPCGPVTVEAAEALRRPPPGVGLLVLRRLQVRHRLHVGDERLDLLRREQRAPGGHLHDRALAQLPLLRIVAYPLRRPVEDPLAQLRLVLRVHGDEPAREGGHLVEAVPGVRHPAEAARPVAGEAALLLGDLVPALDAARTRRARALQPQEAAARGEQHGHEHSRDQRFGHCASLREDRSVGYPDVLRVRSGRTASRDLRRAFVFRMSAIS